MANDTGLLDDISVIDVDTHLTEPHDLWTSRAPAGYEDRVPKVVDIEGLPHWSVDGVVLGRAGSSSVIGRDGGKSRGAEFLNWAIDDTHPAAYDMEARVAVMDEVGIFAQILYPNVAGFGSQKFVDVQDPDVKLLAATIYNDAMAEIQERSGGRLFPMALMPWWDIDASVAEARRAAALGLRGIVTCTDPQNRGLPDLGEDAWNPLWEVCSDLALPVNFHIGASETTLTWYGTSPWPSMGADQKLAIGSAMMYLTNARVMANLIFSGVLERFPALKFVSVESGIGWIPFVLESLDHQLLETAPGSMDYLTMMPSEYFRRQVYGCFWFERLAPSRLIEQVGVDNVLFETDFPHPTCLYPDSAEHLASVLGDVSPEVRRKVLQDNAASLYRIPIPVPSGAASH
jgi:predicted TIM-barrel fold metal-dependent hydrolase